MRPTEIGAVGLTLILVALGIYNGAHVMNDHLATESFPAHAKFHAVLGGAYMVGLSLLALGMVCIRECRRGKGRILLAATLLLLPIGFFVGIGIVPEGSPGRQFVVTAGVGTVVVLLTTVLLFLPSRRT